MKKITFLLMWICTAITFDAISQDCPEPIIVTITSVEISDCEYEVNIDVVPPDIPFEMDDFDLTVLLTGITGIEKEFCDFGLCPMNCTADVGFISLFCGNQTMTSDDVRGGFSAEFSTDGCIDASNITPISSNPCIIFINESKCPDPIPTEDICVQIDLIGQAMNCDLPGNYLISVLSGCNASTSTAFTGPNDGICFPTVDDECIQLDMTQSDCGCAGDIITQDDIVLMTEYILGIHKDLVTPYSFTLGDVDCSGDLTAIDLFHINYVALGIPNDGNGSCPDVGDCVLLDETTGEIVNEFCAGDNVNLVAGVMGDFNNSCDPCNGKKYNDNLEVESINLFDQISSIKGSELAFNQDIEFNSLTITIDRKAGVELNDFTIMTFDQDNVFIDITEGSSEFLVSIFSKEKISVLNGQVFISNNNNPFNLSKKKNALNFVYDNGMKNVNFSDVLSNDMISDINLYKRNNTIYLSDLKTDQPKVLRVTNISGQVVFTKEISRESKDDNFDLIPNNEIIFISIISEHSILTKKLFH